jgi:hypothetical protein
VVVEGPVIAGVAAQTDPVVEEQRAGEPAAEWATDVAHAADATADVWPDFLRRRRHGDGERQRGRQRRA